MDICLFNKQPFISQTGLCVNEVDLTEILPHVPFELSQFTIEVGGYSPDESHPESEIWIINSGCGKLTYNNKSYNLKSGDVVKFSPDITHTVKNVGEDPLSVISIWWK